MRVVEPHEFKSVKHPKQKKRGSKVRILLVLFVLLYVAAVIGRPIPAIKAEADAITPLPARDVAIKWPASGQAAIGAVGYGVLSTHGDQQALPTASVAKVMTALAVLKQRPLHVGEQGPMITISQEDVDYYQKVVSEDGSNVPIVLGEEISEYQALQALLLPSANNMAHTLVRWAYGSEKEYTSFVNSFAKSLGMNSAHFADASGFSPETVSNSEDLAKLAVNAMDNPVIAEIAAQPEATIPVAGTIYNVNMLLGKNGIVGVKTGNTEQAGGCFMAAAERTINGHKVVAVSVIMGANNLSQALRESVPLVTSVLNGFEQVTAIKAGQTVGRYNVPWGSKVDVKAKQDVTGVVWRGAQVRPTVAFKPLSNVHSQIAAQTEVGRAEINFGREQISSPLVTAAVISPPPVTWRFIPRLA